MRKTDKRKERLNKRNHANSVGCNHRGTFDTSRSKYLK